MSKEEMDEGFFSREEHEMAHHRDVFGNIIDRPVRTEPQRYPQDVAQAAAACDKAYFLGPGMPAPQEIDERERQFYVTSDERPGDLGFMGPNMQEYDGATPHMPDWETGPPSAATPLSPTLAHPLLPAARKATPICTGVLDYFPLAIAEVSRVSRTGNEQHNPGEPLHWARDKSTDHADCIARHLIERGGRDTDGERHTAKVAWRALALLQEELENAQ